MGAHEFGEMGQIVPSMSESWLLDVMELKVNYGRRPVVLGVSLRVAPGEVVAIFGHNGAGKTTILNTIFGRIKPIGGIVLFEGRDVTSIACTDHARIGMTLIPAEHFVFAEMTVLDNLKLGAYRERSSSTVDHRIAQVYEIFPTLSKCTGQLAGTMSGGQQRMLSIGIALMTGPRLLLLDEPSLGLSPVLVEQMMAAIRRLAEEQSLSVLLVEQNVIQTLGVVDRAYFIRSGRVILDQRAEELRARESYWELF